MAISQPVPPPFASHARQVVRLVRSSFTDLLTSGGADPHDPQSIGATLGLNKNLAWKISKIVQAEDPLIVLQQMPGASGLKILLSAAEKAGVDPAQLESARNAIAEYEEFIRIHSGDRTTMEMMGPALSPNGHAQSDEYHRKLLFQGASYVWGAQARVVLKIGLVGPGAEDGLLDFASLNGLMDFRRLRPDVSWVMAARSSNNDDGSAMATSASEPIDPRYAAPDQAPLMADFCSKPLPSLRRKASERFTSFELVEGPVGNTGALTCVVGTIQRNIPYYRTPTNEWGEHSARCDTPAELLIVDLYIYEGFPFELPPETLLFSQMGSSPPSPRTERRQLPLHEQLHDLGTGSLPVATPEVRQYNQIVQAMFDRTGWSPGDFRGFRMKIAYPACPTALVLRYPLPEKRGASNAAAHPSLPTDTRPTR